MYSVDTLISLVIVLVMFLIGTTLDSKKFAKIFSCPKAIILGLLLQLILLPLCAFTICSFVDIPTSFKWGVVILSLCPGGAMSNYISYLFKLNTELSVSLTILNSFIILFSIPCGLILLDIMYPLGGGSISLPIQDIITDVIMNVFMPVLGGFFFQKLFKNKVALIEKPIKYITLFLVISAYSIKMFAGSDNGGIGITVADIVQILPIVLGLHLFTMILSYYFSKILRNEEKTSKTITVEVGLQNTSLTLLVASMLSHSADISKPAVVFTLFSTFTTIGFIAILSIKDNNVLKSLFGSMLKVGIDRNRIVKRIALSMVMSSAILFASCNVDKSIKFERIENVEIESHSFNHTKINLDVVLLNTSLLCGKIAGVDLKICVDNNLCTQIKNTELFEIKKAKKFSIPISIELNPKEYLTIGALNTILKQYSNKEIEYYVQGDIQIVNSIVGSVKIPVDYSGTTKTI